MHSLFGLRYADAIDSVYERAGCARTADPVGSRAGRAVPYALYTISTITPSSSRARQDRLLRFAVDARVATPIRATN